MPTLTLLLTDIVDSTALAEKCGDARMAEIWSAHDRSARRLFAQFQGQEIDRTDGFFATFEDTASSLAFAHAFHREMAAIGVSFGITFRARSGIHRGEVILRRAAEEDRARGAKPVEVDGVAKPAAARIMSIALGGQTLLSLEAKNHLGAVDLRVVSHGFYRLKGVAEPVELFEVHQKDAPLLPPPDGAKVYRVVRDGGTESWRPARESAHSLPVAGDAFIGRRSCLHGIAGLVDNGSRLVSLVGIGGAGKTRVALQYARSWLGDYPGGAWFCDLSEARDAEAVTAIVSTALGVTLDAGDPATQLLRAIRGRGRCLLILDNCEQLGGAANAVIELWLGGAQDAQLLVTSREVLGARGEAVLFIPTLEADEAAELFRTRAVAAQSDADLEDDVVRKLVELLDRLPLALELAAARIRVMSGQQLVDRMSERFRLLVSRGPPSRQSTLRATLDWSWDLLDVDEQAGLAQLSVFEGGFDLQAAEKVLALPHAWPLDVLQSLVEKSLLQRAASGRFGLLATVREYARERLPSVHEGNDAARRHGRYYASLLQDSAGRASERHRRRLLDVENYWSAARRGVERQDADVAAGAARAVWQVLARVGPFSAGARLLESVLAVPSLDPRQRVLVMLDGLHAMTVTGRGVEALERGQDLLRSVSAGGDDALHARVLARLATTAYWISDLERSAGYAESALVLAERVNDVGTIADVSATAAATHCMRGDWDAAARTCARALALFDELGDDLEAGASLITMGFIQRHQLAWDAAFASFASSLARARAAGEHWREGMCLLNLADAHRDAGNDGPALDAYASAQAIADACGDLRLAGWVHAGRGRLHLRRRELELAGADLTRAEELLRSVSGRVGLAKMLCSRAELDAALGNQDKAERSLAEANEIAVALGVGEGSELRRFLRDGARSER